MRRLAPASTSLSSSAGPRPLVQVALRREVVKVTNSNTRCFLLVQHCAYCKAVSKSDLIPLSRFARFGCGVQGPRLRRLVCMLSRFRYQTSRSKVQVLHSNKSELDSSTAQVMTPYKQISARCSRHRLFLVSVAPYAPHRFRDPATRRGFVTRHCHVTSACYCSPSRDQCLLRLGRLQPLISALLLLLPSLFGQAADPCADAGALA